MMEILKTALIHTLLGMGTVFIVLILISLIISLFKFIPVLEKKFSKKKLDPGPQTAAPVVPAPVVEETVDETDDLELVAVITAAVAAAMGTTSTDGFVVRSIKRAPGSRWKR